MGQVVSLTKDGVDYGQFNTTSDDIEDRRYLEKIAAEGGYETHPQTIYDMVRIRVKSQTEDGIEGEIWLADTDNGWEKYLTTGYFGGGALLNHGHTYPDRDANDWLSDLDYWLRNYGYRIADGVPASFTPPDSGDFTLPVAPLVAAIRYWHSIGLSDHGDFCHIAERFVPIVKQLLELPELEGADRNSHKYGEWELALENIFSFAERKQIQIPKQIVEELKAIDERLLFGLPESLVADAC